MGPGCAPHDAGLMEVIADFAKARGPQGIPVVGKVAALELAAMWGRCSALGQEIVVGTNASPNYVEGAPERRIDVGVQHAIDSLEQGRHLSGHERRHVALDIFSEPERQLAAALEVHGQHPVKAGRECCDGPGQVVVHGRTLLGVDRTGLPGYAGRRMSRILVVLSLAFGVLFGSIGSAAAQDDTASENPGLSGVLANDDGMPVEGATIEIREVDGDFTAVVITAADGSWSVELPDRGATYEAELLLDTLPEGINLSEAGNALARPRISQPGQQRIVNFLLGGALTGGTSTGDQIAQSLVNGLKFGLIIGMSSIGLSLIFGTTGLINFAHGELVTFGAALAWWLNTQTIEATLILATVIAVIGGAALGGIVELGLMRPLRKRQLGAFQFVVVTIGCSLIGRQLIQIWIGEGNESYRQYSIQEPWTIGPIDITPRDASIIGVALVALIAVATVLQLTRVGKAMRAVSDNADLAASSGIDVNRVILSVWVSGAALAALGGVLFGLSEVVEFDMGFRFLLLIFAAVVLGGLGTAYGAMAGGVLIGLVTEVSTVWIRSDLKFVWALLALILVLLVRPQGILGSKERVG